MAITRQRAFSMFELLVVCGIIIVLASLLLPALAKARLSSKMASTKGNLRQQYIGMMLYRENHDARLEYGSAEEMGLPPLLATSDAYLEVVGNRDVWKSPCCCHKDSPTGYPTYEQYRIDYTEYIHTEEAWTQYVKEFEGDAVLLFDGHCNDSSVDLHRPAGQIVNAVGVRLNGRIETRQRRFSTSSMEVYWNY